MEREARILIIEDDPEWQEIIGGLCEEAASEIDGKGTAISMASSPEEAQRLLENSVERDQPFDLVTIDINLRDPSQDETAEERKEGLKLLENLKASSPETCALIVSGEVKRSGDYEHIIEASRKQSSDFLEKHKLDRAEFKRKFQGAFYYAEAIEYKNDNRFRRAEDAWKKATELAPELSFPVNVGDILNAVRRNPITGLPSGRLRDDQMRSLLDQKEWAVLTVSIDHLDPFYDHYGVNAEDAVLLLTASILKNAMRQSGAEKDFLGHTTRDRFIIITSSVEKAEDIIERSVKAFNEKVGDHYDFKDREEGYKEVPLMRVEIGMVTADDGPFSDLPELAATIARA
jgi:GGDEF domain-containing protein/ActR/RegA family two-component response regulator